MMRNSRYSVIRLFGYSVLKLQRPRVPSDTVAEANTRQRIAPTPGEAVVFELSKPNPSSVS